MFYVLLIAAWAILSAAIWVSARNRASKNVKPRRPQGVKKTRNMVFVDGSNVMHWGGDGPLLSDVQNAVKLLRQKGYAVGVMFDANAGYLLSGAYMNAQDFALQLGVPAEQVLVVNKGVPADLDLLKAARQFRAKVVSNDRFRDWAKEFPEVNKRGFLVHGGFHKGKLWLDFDGSRQRVGKTRKKKRR